MQKRVLMMKEYSFLDIISFFDRSKKLSLQTCRVVELTNWAPVVKNKLRCKFVELTELIVIFISARHLASHRVFYPRIDAYG